MHSEAAQFTPHKACMAMYSASAERSRLATHYQFTSPTGLFTIGMTKRGDQRNGRVRGAEIRVSHFRLHPTGLGVLPTAWPHLAENVKVPVPEKILRKKNGEGLKRELAAFRLCCSKVE